MSNNCYEANPDIAGVGVRVSIYTQAVLSFAPAILASVDGHVDSDEEALLDTIYVNLLLTACALLVSAFIQAATFGLGIYHALIVLNLSWIVNASALIVCIFPSLTRLHHGDTWWQWFQKIWPARRNQLLGLLLVTVHLCAMASLGVRIWVNPGEYGSPTGTTDADVSSCLSNTVFTLFGVDIPVTNNAIRGLSLTIYSITVIPLVNAFAFIILIGIASFYFQRLVSALLPNSRRRAEGAEEAKRKPAYFSAMVIQLLISAYFIINTELMISRSKELVSTKDESKWTFGQTLSMLLTLFPFYKGVMKPIVGKFPTIKFRLEWFLRRFLREASKNWPTLHLEADGKYKKIYRSFQGSLHFFKSAYLHEKSDLPISYVSRHKTDLLASDVIAPMFSSIIIPLEAARNLLDKANELMLLPSKSSDQIQQSELLRQNLNGEDLHNFHVRLSQEISELREMITTAHRARLPGITQRAHFVSIGAILGASIANLDMAHLFLDAFISSLGPGFQISIATNDEGSEHAPDLARESGCNAPAQK